MNTECMYVLKDQTMDAAKDFCKRLDRLAAEKKIELSPSYVSVAKKNFRVTPDYDGYMTPFTVKKGTIFVWADGKLHNMMEQKIKGGRRCFPFAMNWDEDPEDLMEDVWEYGMDTRTIALKKCYSMEGFADLPLEEKNRIYDATVKEIVEGEKR